MTTPQEITRQDLIDFVVLEARLLDAKRYEEWNALFTDDAIYWVPLARKPSWMPR
jgi:3-phenylpropionate/cinnamic acid dioxygenase small subunit